MQNAFVDVDQNRAMVISGFGAEFGRRSGYFVSPVQDDILPVVDGHVQASHPPDGPANDVQIAPAVVIRLVGEERAVDIALIVIDRAASGIPSGQVNSVFP